MNRTYNKMKTWYVKLQKAAGYTSICLCMLVTAACNKDFVKKIKMHDPGDTVVVNIQQRKVLYLIVDGLRGRIIPQINPPNITAMTSNSIYAYDGVSDVSNKEVTDWADMLTGVKSGKHKVTSPDFAGNDLQDYPPFFARLKEVNPSWRTAAFCSNTLLSSQLTKDASINKSYNSDDKSVKNAIVNELQEDSAKIVFGEFSGVESAGQQYGYDSSSIEYVNAIIKVDNYIGEIMDALKKRKNYANENWLVIVASDKGGPVTIPPSQQDNTIFGNPALNNFIIFYNERFASRFIPKPNTANIPYEGYTIKLRNTGDDAINASVPADKADIYNFGTSGEYTVQLKVKVFNWGSVWPSFFGKRQDSYNSGYPGWIFMFHGANEWRVILRGITGPQLTFAVQPIALNEWHTLTLKIYNEDGARMAAIYTDGNKSNPFDITGLDISNDLPLTSGYIAGWTGTQSELYITDVKFWNTAIPDSIIAADGGKVGVDTTSQYYTHLMSYWSCTEGIGDRFKDYGPAGNDMLFNITSKNKNNFSWEKFSDLSGLIFPPLPKGLQEQVPQGIDIPFMIYDWIGMQTSKWDLDGKAWIPAYVDVPN